jgi:ribonucleoside-diphosphate reductase alpha chain
MPTASTSQILGNNECFEPFTTNIYTRRTLAGEFTVINKYLLSELMDAGLWSERMKQEIVARNGSVQGIAEIPPTIQARYKTGWEIKQRCLIDMAAGRGAFIDQSQSLNLFVADPNYAKLTSMHFYTWKTGLKTGCYYLRTKAPTMAQKFTVDPRLLAAVSGGAPVKQEDDEAIPDSDAESEDELLARATPAQAAYVAAAAADAEADAKAAKKKLLDKLAAEYEESLTKDDGCLMCSG